MRKRIFITISILAMASLLLSVRSYSQDRALYSRVDSLLADGRNLFEQNQYELAIVDFEKALKYQKTFQGERHPDQVICLAYLGNCCFNLGNYSAALQNYQQLLPLIEYYFGEEHPFYANVNTLLGFCYHYLGDYYHHLDYYNQADSFFQKSLPYTLNSDFAYGLSRNGSFFYHRSIYEPEDRIKALSFYQQIFVLFEKVYPEYLASIDRIGDCFFNDGDFPKALKYFQESLLIRESFVGKDLTGYYLNLEKIGSCYDQLGDDKKAEEFCQKVSVCKDSLCEKGLSCLLVNRLDSLLASTIEVSSPLFAAKLDADSLYEMGCTVFLKGQYHTAIDLFSQSSEILSGLITDNYLTISYSLEDHGLYYLDDYEHSRAMQAFIGAYKIKESILGSDHIDCARTIRYIGLCYHKIGDYWNALEKYQRVLSIREKALGKEHTDYASILNSIGNVYSSLHYNAQALEYYLPSSLIYKKNKDYWSLAAVLSNMGKAYEEIGDYFKARDNNEQAIEILTKLGRDDLRAQYNSIGNCFFAMGDFNRALDYYKKAGDRLDYIANCFRSIGDFESAQEYYLQDMENCKSRYKSNHPYYALTLNNLGLCYQDMGKYEEALNYHLQAMLIFKDGPYGKQVSEYASALQNVGICSLSLGNPINASELLSNYSEIIIPLIAKSFSTLTESRRASFWDKYSNYFTDQLYGYTAFLSTSKMNCAAYDGVLLGKGLLLNAEIEMRTLILESGDDEALRLFKEIQQERVKLDKKYDSSISINIEALQQELVNRCAVVGDYTRNLALKWTDVQTSLGKKDIAIEFETYTHKDTTFYIALTLRPGYTEPHLVKLFNSKQLRDKSSSKLYYTSSGLSNLIWGNLSDELKGVKNVYFSPAGELNNIGIEYMVDADGKHLLSEKRNYYRLTSTRELVKERKPDLITDATVYGGIKYDITPSSNLTGTETESEKLARAATRSYIPLDSLSLTRGGSVWEYLDGSEKEAEAISSTLTSIGVHNDLFMGEAGTEESFKALSGAKKDIIHIATHGFYWTETEADRRKENTSSFMMSDESAAPKEDKALTRSGLLFAGAQNTFDGKDIPIDVEDGILTAKDISRLDLRGTDLVVLSACQSGLGEVTGEGVFGLQRSFKKAGVQSIIMSLWEVGDDATRILMTRFYENLAKGKNKYDAFKDAQKHLRQSKDQKGNSLDDPEYYAAFVLLDAIK